LTRLKIKAELFLPPTSKPARGRGAGQPEDNPAMQEIWHVVGAIPREQTRRLLAEKVVVKKGRVSRDFLITLEER
jgi:hypothetical protein